MKSASSDFMIDRFVTKRYDRSGIEVCIYTHGIFLKAAHASSIGLPAESVRVERERERKREKNETVVLLSVREGASKLPAGRRHPVSRPPRRAAQEHGQRKEGDRRHVRRPAGRHQEDLRPAAEPD